MLRSVQTLGKISDIENSPKFKEFQQEKLLKSDKMKEILLQLS